MFVAFFFVGLQDLGSKAQRFKGSAWGEGTFKIRDPSVGFFARRARLFQGRMILKFPQKITFLSGPLLYTQAAEDLGAVVGSISRRHRTEAAILPRER